MMAVFVPTQVPLGIAEGVVTALAYRFVLERRPDLLGVRSGSHKLDLDAVGDSDVRPELLEAGTGSRQITGVDA